MSVLTISDSGAKSKWPAIPGRVQRSREQGNPQDRNTLTFISDFTSPADEITKNQPPKSESQKPEKRSRPFSHTSENWIG